MRTKTEIAELVIDGIWSDHNEEFPIIVRSNDRMVSSAHQLKTLLFGWHEASWYGTEIEEGKMNGKPVLHLTAKQGLEFFSAPNHVRMIRIEFSERLIILSKIALMIKAILKHGWFAPNAALWKADFSSWIVDFPGEMKQKYEPYYQQLIRFAEEQGHIGIDQWLSCIINELKSTIPGVGKSWRALAAHVGEHLLNTKPTDEEEWLIAIGFTVDTLPFKVSLLIREPALKDQAWVLQPALQDRSGGEWYHAKFHELSGQWRLFHRSGELANIPLSWARIFQEKLHRDSQKWYQLLPHLQLNDLPMLRDTLTEQEAFQFLEQDSTKLLEAGCPVILPAWWETVRQRRLRLKGKVKSSVGSVAQPMFGLDQIVQFDWRLALGESEISEEQFIELARQNKSLVQVGDQWVYLHPDDVAQVKKWLKLVGKRKGLTFRDVLQMHLRGEELELFDENADYDVQTEIELNEHLTQWLHQLQHIQDLPLLDPPPLFKGELRPYQQQGMSWLIFLRSFGLGAVLADDMGLGKTIQYVAYLAHIKENEPVYNEPSLLICPTSVIGNWEKEVQRFVPRLKVVIHYGTKRPKDDEFKQLIKDADLVITSYSLAQIDEEMLSEHMWNSLCLDEAQNIKNVYTKQSSAIRRLSAKHKVALTGTPMENRLTELWSIYDFVNPGYLGSLYQFRKAMITPIERTKNQQLIESLQRWVSPFMLRRIKKDPAISLSLPDKLESKSYIPLTAEQVALYEGIVNELMEQLDKQSAMQRKGLILATLTKLKQLCDHPALLLKQEDKKHWDVKRSKKLERLVEMVEQVYEEKERCLIFTQYVEMGLQLKKLLEHKFKLEVPYLHGGIPKIKRDEMIESFQDENQPRCAFVLSLKAGGTGLNLTAANHVIHFDRWWNPAVENQATDRAFRIGQKKQVHVHKFITVGTLEEKIDEMIEGKQQLNDQIIRQSDQWITELSNTDLKELFTLRNTWLKE